MKTLAMAVALALQGSTRVVSMCNHSAGGMSSGSAFDPKAFLDMQTDQATSTVRVPIPARQMRAFVSEVDMSGGTSKEGKPWMRLDVVYEVDDPTVKAELGREKVTISQGIMLDRTPEGGLDYSKGRNVILGRLREAVGLNTPGQPFSFRMLVGKPLQIVVSHKPSTRPGAQPGDVFEDVTGFVKI